MTARAHELLPGVAAEKTAHDVGLETAAPLQESAILAALLGIAELDGSAIVRVSACILC
jgi:hypothetical protein